MAPSGLASYAISAIDLALWDLKGKLLKRPVYELLGGPAREKHQCYATGNDTDWHMELGFTATKLACPYRPRRWPCRRSTATKSWWRAPATLIGPEGRADARLLDGVRRRVRRAPGRAAAALRPEMDRGLPDARGYGRLADAAPAPAVADAGDRRALVHASRPSQAAARPQRRHLPARHRPGSAASPPCVKICHLAEAAGVAGDSACRR